MLPAGLPCYGGPAGVRLRRRPTSSRSSTNELVRPPRLNPATAHHGRRAHAHPHRPMRAALTNHSVGTLGAGVEASADAFEPAVGDRRHDR